MNKSLVLINKIYLFCFLVFSFFLLIYLLSVLFGGDRGLFSYYKEIRKHSVNIEKLNSLDLNNKNLEDKISRLTPNTLDLDYLDELLIIQTGKTANNEIIINLEN